MRPCLLVHVHTEADGGWRIGVGGLGERQVSSRLSADQVEALRAELQRALAPAGLLLPDEARVRAGEEAAGRAMGAVLRASPGVIARTGQAVGEARAAGVALTLVLDLAEPELWALPWELLALDELPAEPEGRALVVRLGPGGERPLDASLLRPLWWTLDAEDAEVQELLAAVQHHCQAVGLPAAEPVELARLARHEAAVLFLVTHGAREQELVRFLGPEGDQGGGAVSQALAGLLPRTALAVVLVCDGDHRTARQSEALVERLLRAGARACLATAERLPVHAAEALVSGLLPALAQQRRLGRAVLDGRAAVGALADPAPEARWWRLAVTTSSAQALAWRPSTALPAAWRPGPQARALLHRALQHAERRQQRWLGSEHLVLALLEDSRHLSPSQLQALFTHGPRVERFLARFKSRLDQPLRPSPRLDAVLSALPAGFEVRALATALVASYPLCLRTLLTLAASGDETFTETHTEWGTLEEGLLADDEALWHSTTWHQLEVLGGPEDGRRLTLESGQLLGRGFPKQVAEVRLYEGCGAFDQSLSSRHLRCLEEKRLAMMRRGHARITHLGTLPLQGDGPFVVEGDELLGLTKATWLWAVPDDQGGAPR